MKELLWQWDPLWVSVLSLSLYAGVMLGFFKFFGKMGLYVYMSIAVIGANLQVLKVSYFEILGSPVALGTALFATTYLASDLLSEYYGKRAAQLGIAICFGGLLFWALLTFLLLSYAPLTVAVADPNYLWALGIHEAMDKLFVPVPAIFVASLLAFSISQLNDIFVYGWIKNRTKGKFLFLRNNFSTVISALIDNAIFSITAFVILASDPIPLRELIFAYILGTYGLRILFALLDTPFIYMAKWLVPPDRVGSSS